MISKLRNILIFIMIAVMIAMTPCQALAYTVNYKSDVSSHEAARDDSTVTSYRTVMYPKTYAMVFDTGTIPGGIVDFFLIKYKTSTNATRYYRIDAAAAASSGMLNVSTAELYEQVQKHQTQYELLMQEFYQNQGNPLTKEYALKCYRQAEEEMAAAEQTREQIRLIENNGTAVYENAPLAADNARMIGLARDLMPDDPSLKGNTNDSEMTRSDDMFALLDEESRKKSFGKTEIKPYLYGSKAPVFASNTKSVIFFDFDFSSSDIKVQDIEVFLRPYNTGSGVLDSWDLKSWDIYEVNKSMDAGEICYRMYSNLSAAMLLNFTGKKLFSAVNIDDGLSIDSSYLEQSISKGDSNLVKIPVSGTGTVTPANGYYEETVSGVNSKTYPRFVAYSGSPDVTSYSDRDYYTVLMNIPDTNCSGLELLDKAVDMARMNIHDPLIADIEYEDGAGRKQTVKIPVITNALLKLADGTTVKEEIEDGKILSFAQQGEKIAFDALLPNCKAIKKIELTYRNIDGESKEEVFSVNAIKVYRRDTATVSGREGAFLSSQVMTSSSPVCSYTATTYNGTSVYCGTTESFMMKQGGDSDYPERSVKNNYFITLKTANIPNASTRNDVKFSLNYLNTKGKESQTQEYRLSELVSDFYGNWKGLDSRGNSVDAALPYGLRSGGEISCIISVNDVSEFTGISISLGDDNKDDWQLDGIEIIRVTSMSERIGKTIREAYTAYNGGDDNVDETLTVNGVTVDRFYYRDVTGETELSKKNLEMLVQENQKRTHKFTSQDDDDDDDPDDVDEDERNFNKYKYSMDWKTANQDLRFMENVRDYTVKVNVPTNSSQGVVDDGCGSKNLFYFQLVFKDGESGFVLANSQMTTDGFVSGSSSAFNISMNEDLGEIVGINIIPDDIDENSDILDKLCISSIEITRNNRNGINKSYIVDDVGWINREYHSQDATGLKGKLVGRPYNELVCSYPVSYSQVNLKYEVEIVTGVSSKESLPQYRGPLKADITYLNSKGEIKTTKGAIDVAKALYEYTNTTPMVEDGQYVTNPEIMLRPETTDRFQISLSDAVTIRSIKLIADSPDVDALWNIKAINIGIVTSKSVLRLNNNNEYQMKYENPKDPILLADKISNVNMPYNFSIAKGMMNSKLFEFEWNEIPIINDDSDVINVVPRVPESGNDTVNIYVHLSDKAVDPEVYRNTLSAEIFYSGARLDYSNKRDLKKMTDGDGNIIMYAEGLSAKNLTTLNNLQVYSNIMRDGSRSDLNMPIAYAIVQQMRGNTLVNTYYLPFNGADPCLFSANAGVGCSTPLSGKRDGDNQEVMFVLGGGTTSATLNPMVYDVAVAMEYVSKNGSGSENRTVLSPYIYLTDQEITNLMAGQKVSLNFDEPYVDEIKNIKVVATGGLMLDIDSGYITKKDVKGIITGRYSFKSENVIHNTIATLPVNAAGEAGEDSLSEVKFTIRTMDAGGSTNTGTNKPATLDITYEQSDGTIAVKQLTVSGNVDGKGLAAGDTMEVYAYLENLKTLRTVKISTEDSWGIESIAADVDRSGRIVTTVIKIGEIIYADNPYIVNFADIVVHVKAVSGQTDKTVDNGTVEILSRAGDAIAIDVDVIGSVPGSGYTYLVEKIMNNASSTQNVVSTKTNTGVINFVAPITTLNNVETYRITIRSNESPTVKSTVVIVVEPYNPVQMDSEEENNSESEEEIAEDNPSSN